MSQEKTKRNPLKAKFNKIEQKLYPEGHESKRSVAVKPQAIVDNRTSDFIKLNSKKIKSHKKLLLNCDKQLEKNKDDLKVLIELKDDNHYKLEKINQQINETKTTLNQVETSIKELQHERIDDEARLGKLQTTKVELEGEIADSKRQKEILTSDYHNLLNSIYLKESELGKRQEDLAQLQVEIESIEKDVARETRQLKTLALESEKTDYHFQKAKVKNKNLESSVAQIQAQIRKTQEQKNHINKEVYAINGDNERLVHQIKDLEEQKVLLQSKYDEQNSEIEGIREINSDLNRQKDHLNNQIKGLKSEYRKNILEIEGRDKEKSALELKTNELLSKKSSLENAVYEQKSKIQSLQSSIHTLGREKNEISDSIKVNQLHFDRHETEIVKLRKEISSLKNKHELLLNENERVKNLATDAKHRFIDVKTNKQQWEEKNAVVLKSIAHHKEKIHTENSNIEQYLKNIADLQADMDSKKADINRYKKIHAHTQTQANKLKDEHSEVSGSYKKLLQQRSGWSERVLQREEYIKNVENEISKLKENIYQTEQEVDQHQIRLDEYNSSLISYKQQQDYLKRELSAQKDKKMKFVEKITYLKQRVEELEGQKQALCADIDGLKDQVVKSQKQLPELKEQQVTLTEAISGAKSEYAHLKKKFAKLRQEITLKEQENSDLQSEFERIHLVTQNLNKENQFEKQDLEKRFSKLTRQKTELKSKIQEQKNQLSRLTTQKRELAQSYQELESTVGHLKDQKLSIDKKVKALQESNHQKAMEIQSFKANIKENSIDHNDRQQQLNKLTDRSQYLEKQLQDLKDNNEVEQDVSIQFSGQLRKLHDKNAHMASLLEHEVKRKDQIRQKITGVKRDIQRLKESFVSEKGKMGLVKITREKLEAQYLQLREQKESLLDEIELKMTSFEAEGVRNKELSTKIREEKNQIQELKNTDVLKKDIKNIYTRVQDLKTSIAKTFNSAKNASVMSTIAEKIVQTISENEFDDLKWVSKTDSNKTHDGMRIRFKNMQTQYSEVKKIVSPLTKTLSEQFKAYGIEIETRTQTSPGEVIEAIDFKVTLEVPQEKRAQA